MREAVIVAAARTAIANFGGPFKDVPVAKLASYAVAEAVKRAKIDGELVDNVLMGYVLQSSEAPNVARLAGLYAGLNPEKFVATTLNYQCGSSLEAVNQSVRLISLGEAEVCVAGGVEIMSRGPFLMYEHRWGHKAGTDALYDYFEHISATVSSDLYGSINMAGTAENVAKKYGITRQEADEFAVLSHHKAVGAQDAGRFDEEIFPVEIPQRKGNALVVCRDERPRKGTSLDSVSKLPPVFNENGIVTAANASGVNDGASAVVVMSREKAQELGLDPLVTIKGYGVGAVHPTVMGLGPVPAIRSVLKKLGMNAEDIGLFELNEAFATQALGVIKELELPIKKVNVNGGAIALGHPVGCSGTRILVTLINEMRHRGEKFGLASLCCGGGLGVATVVENSRL